MDLGCGMAVSTFRSSIGASNIQLRLKVSDRGQRFPCCGPQVSSICVSQKRAISVDPWTFSQPSEPDAPRVRPKICFKQPSR